MTKFYKTSADYHDALDRREAHERAEQAERELNEAKPINTSSIYSMCPNCTETIGRHYNARFTNCLRCSAKLIPPIEPKCCCLEFVGDNENCPIHGKPAGELLDPRTPEQKAMDADAEDLLHTELSAIGRDWDYTPIPKDMPIIDIDKIQEIEF